MPPNSTLGVARVYFQAETGNFNRDISEAEARYRQTTGAMSDDALRMQVAQERLQRTLARYGPESRQAAQATLQLRAAQRQATVGTAQLSGELGSVSRHTAQAGSGLRTLSRDAEHAAYGVTLGTRAIRGLRSAVFFSASGLAAFGLTSVLRSVREAAIGQQATLKQLQVALHAAGLAQSAYAGTVRETLDAQGRLGFGEEESARAFALAIRATRSVEGATRLLAAASDVARGSGRGLEQSTLLVTRAYQGQSGSLRRVGIDIGKNIKGYQAVDAAQRKFAGAASAYADSAAGSQARLNVAVHHTEETIGTALLPVITSLNSRLSRWLDNSHNQERIQQDVNRTVRVGTKVAHDFGEAVHGVSVFVSPLVRGLGGMNRTLHLLAGAFIGLKLVRVAQDMGLIAARTRAAGSAAAVAAGEYNAMATAEGRAAAGSILGGAFSGPNIFSPGGSIPNRDLRSPGGPGGLPFGALALLPLYALGSTRDLGQGFLIPVIGGHGRNYYASVDKPNWRPGQTITYQGEKFIYYVRGGRAALVAVDYIQQLQGIQNATGAGEQNPRANVPGSPAYLPPSLAAPARRYSLQGQLNLAANRYAKAQLTAGTGDDVQALKDQASILRRMIAREKNLSKQTDEINQLGVVESSLASIRQTKQRAGDAAARKADAARRKAAEEHRKAARAAEQRAFGGATDILQPLTARARRLAGRGQFDQERQVLKEEEHDLERYVNDTSLSLTHRRQLRRRLDQVRQQIDDIARQIKKAAAKAAAARDTRQELLIQRAEARAALTAGTGDDIRAYRAEENLVKRKLAALGRIKKLTNDQIREQTDLLQRKKQIEDQIKQIRGDSTANSKALIQEFLAAQRGLYGGAPNVFTQDANGARTPGSTVVVNQHFNAPPTSDGHREAILAKHAAQAVFD